MAQLDQGTLDSIASVAAGCAEEMEVAGRCDPTVVAALRDAGLFRMLVPASVGGGECSPAEYVAAVAHIAAANPSAGWCLMIAASTGSIAGWMAPNAAAEVFGADEAIAGGTYAPVGRATSVDGDTVSVSGRWQWGSGSQHCTWLFGGVVIDDGTIGLAAMPSSDVTIIENWDVVGMRGTGSHDWSVEGVEVPGERLVRLLGSGPVAEGPLYRFPLFGLLALGVSAVSLGIGDAALTAIGDLASSKRPSGGRSLVEKSTFQREFGQATARHQASRALLFDAVGESWESAQAGNDPTIEQRARLRLAATHAVHTATETARFAYTAGGGDSVRRDSPLQRLLRDSHVATQHVMVGTPIYEGAARPLLGLEVNPGEL